MTSALSQLIMLKYVLQSAQNRDHGFVELDPPDFPIPCVKDDAQECWVYRSQCQQLLLLDIVGYGCPDVVR